MGNKQRVRVYLDSKDIANLTIHEIRMILRAANDLIATGGRTLLAKILKGSRAKDILQHALDSNPAHGFYRELKMEDVLARIDWMIQKGYLRIEYSKRLPLLVFSDRGWKIERDTYTNELLNGFDEMLKSGGESFEMGYLKDRDRGMIFLLLDKVESSGDSKYIPLLDAWKRVDYKKVRERIDLVINRIRKNEKGQSEP